MFATNGIGHWDEVQFNALKMSRGADTRHDREGWLLLSPARGGQGESAWVGKVTDGRVKVRELNGATPRPFNFG
jgi:hypothetical protein